MPAASRHRWLAAVGRWAMPDPRRFPERLRVPAFRLRNAGLEVWPIATSAEVPGVGTVACNTADMIQRYLFLFGIWEPALTELLRAHLRDGDTVVDVGANIGYYTLLAARLVGERGAVLAFEPSSTVRAQLVANLERNAVADRVTVLPCAAGPVEGVAEIFLAPAANLGQTSTRPGPGFSSEGAVPVRRIDDCVAPGVPVAVMKVDCEGDEYGALQGAERVMADMASGAVVLVEVDAPRMAARGATPELVLLLMAERGFAAHELANPYEVSAYVRRQSVALTPLDGVPTTADLVFIKG